MSLEEEEEERTVFGTMTMKDVERIQIVLYTQKVLTGINSDRVLSPPENVCSQGWRHQLCRVLLHRGSVIKNPVSSAY